MLAWLGHLLSDADSAFKRCETHYDCDDRSHAPSVPHPSTIIIPNVVKQGFHVFASIDTFNLEHF